MRWPWNSNKSIKILSPCDGYNRWAPVYAHEKNPIKSASDEFILRHFPEIKNKTVLDAGCGTGYFCSVAYDRGASRIKGIDLSPAMLEEARVNCPHAELIHADLSVYPLAKEQYDLVICGLVLGHLQNAQTVLGSLNASLRPGGILLLTDFHPVQSLKNSKRTFKDQSGNVYEIQHFMHPLPMLLACLQDHHIKTEALEEPQWNGEPIIYGIKAIKK